MSVVICKDLMKRFGDGLAVNNVDLEVREGEFLMLWAHRALARPRRCVWSRDSSPPRAEILIADHGSTNAPHKRDIGMVFQNYALFPHKIFDNIAYPLRLRQVPRRSNGGSMRRGMLEMSVCGGDGFVNSRVVSSSESRWAARSSATRASC